MSDNKLANTDKMFGNLSTIMKGDINITSQQVVDVKVSKLQNALNSARASLEKKFNAQSKALSAVEKQISEKARKEVEAVSSEPSVLIKELILYGIPKVKFVQSISSINFDTKTIDFNHHISYKTDSNSHYDNALGSKTDSVSMSQELIAINDKRKEIVAEINDITEKLEEVRRQLARIPDVERTVRAQIAAYMLSKTEGGDELLNVIDQVEIPAIDDLIKSLGNI